jgi:hypothetical protein
VADDFAAQIKAFRDKALLNANTVVQEATAGIAAALVERTPIDKTPLRANWQFTVGAPGSEADYALEDHSPGGSETAGQMAAKIREVPAGGVTYIVNCLEYMSLIEYGLYTNIRGGKRSSGKTINGFSTQAPAGVRGITAIEWEESFVKPAIAKLSI